MKIHAIYLVLLSGLCFAFSCRQKSKVIEAPVIIDKLSKIVIDDANISQYLVIDSILQQDSLELIPLETKNDNLIGVVANILTTDSLYLIYEQGLGKFFVFNKSGRYIKELASLGKGPNEHLAILDSRYNKYSKTLEISDISSRLISYNISDGTIKNINNELIKEYQAVRFFPLNKDTYTLYNNFSYIKGADGFRFNIIKGNKLVFKSLPFEKDHLTPSTESQFYMFGDSVRFFEPFKPIVYSVMTTGLTPIYYIEYKKDNISPNLLSDPAEALKVVEKRKISTLNDFKETSKYAVVSFKVDKYRAYSLFDKSKNKSLGSSYGGYLIESLGLPIPNLLYSLGEDKFVTVLNGTDLVKIKKGLMRAHQTTSLLAKKILKLNLSEFDNPVLLTLKFKK